MFSALDIKTLMQGTLYGDPSLRVDTIRPIHSPLVGGLSIVMTPGDLLHIPTTGADIIIGPEEIISSNAKAKIVVDYLNVNNLNKVLRYFKVHKYRLFEQENTSTIPDVYIGKHCQIGMNCHFMPGVKIMNCVTIGDNVAIHANTVIKEGTIIGNDVIIGDDVEIGCNNTIDRGTLGDTIIGQGTRIDNQVQIGHDCIIGNKCLIVSQCGFSGHVVLGDHVITHGQVGIAGHISIGSYSVIKAKSGVSHSCPEKSDLFGYPAKNTREYNKNLAVLNKLTKQHGVYKQ
ncbi:TPA: UDP-3-O-(3-hydroxymyristoyl)glucosamine N-acyltransferase [Escherichia coli]|uniref:UDP-3-O-(3-hydroxymyristoyl)glucosamine N-acyltransferase n=1 Tax=Escherichia coli TaxID=562 RepID=UPI000EF7C6C6|nr:UDP-3-O-(3-hydroxymyristoyl)glucosamine N-acyltransferase [Escherichia coli]MCA7385900.1 UDP-3-O-(3-hydroxymyristoyl)glucosamine N-acyltransferase [Escherichia coli]MCT9903054.1 UDP-3-O-(3-hydroxymyristoyl)glucosamine N-acyltransferase [Escherichia coli]MCT9911972.1 UDP-3-O-(3-hydroxymyristoyl)glucosamine N-acyltransferase [Escherichia coli]MCW9829382.1 UDP-3-O-(3-hydroxymyristoyl)glucosamine N-acyltransferase [Escherichia coli]MDC6192931.1 UDP-3-O-(3-hydroxymyristoyl)glucosamine N-acyltran